MLAKKRLRPCSYMISAPGVTSSQDLDLVQSQRSNPRSVTGPELSDVVGKTLTEPCQIVTIIVARRRRFMLGCPS